MRLPSILIIFTVNLGFMYVGFKSLPFEQIALVAVAFTGVSMGGFKLLKLR